MLNSLRSYLASCRLDRERPGTAPGPFDRVHGLLSQRDGVPQVDPSPALRSRIMEGLRRTSAPQPHGWRWAAVALGCLALCLAAIPLLYIARPRPAAPGVSVEIPIPTGPAPVFRLVAGSVDAPLLDQAQKMYSDTRRATRAVASCVPFARGG